jgi:predicted ATPase
MAFTRAARAARTVVLTGPAGIGKTTLVQQMRAPLGQQLGYFIAGKFDQLQRDVPSAPSSPPCTTWCARCRPKARRRRRAWRDAIVAAVGATAA